MKSDEAKRALTAIVIADVVGYSRLMGQNEADAVRRLRACRTDLVQPLLARHRGRLVDAAGDSLLMEFASVVDAVEAAVAFQQGLVPRNAPLEPSERLEYRVGVNIGDVIVHGRTLYGDGVNVAARLQALAPPGGICVSRAVVEQIRGKIVIELEDLGPQALKNIALPVDAFAISPEVLAALPAGEAVAPLRRRGVLALAAAALVGLAALGAGAHLYLRARPDPAFAAKLDKAILALEPGLDEDRRRRLIADYNAAKPHRAFAFAPAAATHWWTADWPGGSSAQEKALERCQIRFEEPCSLVAVDDATASPGDGGPHDMARVRYIGKFDPAQLPGVRRAVATRTDVADYGKASWPKAMAIHPRGVLTVSVGAPSQHLAEVRALKLCNDDDAARDADGVCYLYAVGDDVVLSQRLTKPLTAK